MSDTAESAVNSGPLDYAPPASSQEPITLDEAMGMLGSTEDEKQSPEGAEETATPNEPAQAASEPEEAPAEETEETDPEQPAIDPPRSWTKEAKERWSALPRDTQEYLAQRESERDRGLARSQNELAEQRKAFEAERQATSKARSDYEAKLPALMQALHNVNNQQFPDIQSQADLDKLATEDPFRWIQFQTHQQRMQAAQAELNAVEQRKSAEEQSSWTTHMETESAKFAESVPEAERASLSKMREKAPAFLEERGFSQNELNDLANGKSKLSIFDHRIQSLVHDSMKLAEIKSAPLKAAPKPLPPVTRPGTSQGVVARTNAAKASSLQSLSQKLSDSGSVDDALALLNARRVAR